MPNPNLRPEVKPRHIPQVFVVDDEKTIASTLTATLNVNGYRAQWFDNPLEALQAVRYARPDLLISDVVMPELSGVDLAIQLKERYPACKVLLFSGQALTADLLLQARKKGHYRELPPKPIHPTEPLARIKNADDLAPEKVKADTPRTLIAERIRLWILLTGTT